MSAHAASPRRPTQGQRPPAGTSTRIAIVIALPEESRGRFESRQIPVHYTGLGKVNATLLASELILNQRATHILNFGTAGSRKFQRHAVVECVRFLQRDMDLTALGFKAGETPGDAAPTILTVDQLFTGLEIGSCATGDQLVDGALWKQVEGMDADVVDMEAYALAKCCWRHDVRFHSFKYISDGAGDAAPQEWLQSLEAASLALVDVFDRLREHLSSKGPVEFV